MEEQLNSLYAIKNNQKALYQIERFLNIHTVDRKDFNTTEDYEDWANKTVPLTVETCRLFENQFGIPKETFGLYLALDRYFFSQFDDECSSAISPGLKVEAFGDVFFIDGSSLYSMFHHGNELTPIFEKYSHLFPESSRLYILQLNQKHNTQSDISIISNDFQKKAFENRLSKVADIDSLNTQFASLCSSDKPKDVVVSLYYFLNVIFSKYPSYAENKHLNHLIDDIINQVAYNFNKLFYSYTQDSLASASIIMDFLHTDNEFKELFFMYVDKYPLDYFATFYLSQYTDSDGNSFYCDRHISSFLSESIDFSHLKFRNLPHKAQKILVSESKKQFFTTEKQFIYNRASVEG